MNQPLDIFLHIPKTGGITMYQILEHNYPPERIWKVYPDSWEDLQIRVAALPQERRAGLRLLTGHIPYGVHLLLKRPARYFTMLRHPVERTISYYDYVRTHPDNPQHAPTQTQGLEEYISSGLLLDNGQTRWLANVGREVPFGHMKPRHLEQAKAHLKTFAAIGLLERYDESLLLMKHALGWRWLWYRKRNVNRFGTSYRQIPAKTRERIAEIHALDDELYRYAESLFERQAQRLGRTALQREEVFFRRANRLYGLAFHLYKPFRSLR